ncbi:MAG: LpxI family protein [Planctomycetota bacterium]
MSRWNSRRPMSPEIAPAALPCPTAPPGAPAPSRIGLLAGWGRFPIIVAEALQAQGHSVYCLGVKHHADANALRARVTDYREIGLARIGTAIRYYRRHQVQRATMAGKIHKVRLFDRRAWVHIIPDWVGLCTFFPHYITRRQDRRDDTLLSAIIQSFAAGGVQFAPATDYAPELLVKLGHLAGPAPTPAQQQDIQFGWRLAKEMGRLDVGQSVAVKGRAVLAVEAIEGTDQCIRRAGTLCQAGGFSVVKVAKPQQDMRFDVPTIGLGTLTSLIESGGKLLAVEAHKTIWIDREECVRLANQHRICLLALPGDTDLNSPENSA